MTVKVCTPLGAGAGRGRAGGTHAGTARQGEGRAGQLSAVWRLALPAAVSAAPRAEVPYPDNISLCWCPLSTLRLPQHTPHVRRASLLPLLCRSRAPSPPRFSQQTWWCWCRCPTRPRAPPSTSQRVRAARRREKGACSAWLRAHCRCNVRLASVPACSRCALFAVLRHTSVSAAPHQPRPACWPPTLHMTHTAPSPAPASVPDAACIRSPACPRMSPQAKPSTTPSGTRWCGSSKNSPGRRSTRWRPAW